MLSGLYKKSIYPQTGLFTAEISTTLNSSFGSNCEFGFSGNNSVLSFSCQSGYVFNKKNNEGITGYDLIGSYKAGVPFAISGDFSRHAYNVYVDNDLKLMGEGIPTTGFLNYFYINAVSGVEDVSLNMKGNVPLWSYEKYGTYLSGEGAVFFDLYNNSPWPYKIFSGQVLANTGAFGWSGNTYLTVSGNSTGTYGLTVNNFLLGERSIPLLLHTNFGNVNLYVTGSGYANPFLNFSISILPRLDSIFDEIQNNYTVTVLSSTGIPINVSLEYVSGATGNFFENAYREGDITGLVTGFISGCGFITGSGTYTGYISGYNPLLSGYESGIGTGIDTVSFFTCGTGIVTGTGTGLASGYISTYTGTRQFSGVWDLITGNGVTSTDFRSGNYIVGQNRYINVPIGNQDYGTYNANIQVFVQYNSGTISGGGVIDLTRLLVTGNGTNSGFYLYITGLP
jgi:hypothetical protein